MRPRLFALIEVLVLPLDVPRAAREGATGSARQRRPPPEAWGYVRVSTEEQGRHLAKPESAPTRSRASRVDSD